MFINNVMLCVTEDYNTVSKKIKNREEFYKKLFEMNYINARYNLKVDDSVPFHKDEVAWTDRGYVLKGDKNVYGLREKVSLE